MASREDILTNKIFLCAVLPGQPEPILPEPEQPAEEPAEAEMPSLDIFQEAA